MHPLSYVTRHCVLPTVKIVADGQASGYVIINEADFDPKQHVRFDDAPPSPKTTYRGR
jgi:hypothetical protein